MPPRWLSARHYNTLGHINIKHHYQYHNYKLIIYFKLHSYIIDLYYDHTSNHHKDIHHASHYYRHHHRIKKKRGPG